MYLFSIYTINTLKAQGIVREDFDSFHVDLSLIESFDYDALIAEYKSHFKKPRATKALKHSSEVLRDSSDDVVVALANEFYENGVNTPICFDINQALNDAAASAAALDDVAPSLCENGTYESSHNNNNNSVLVGDAAAAAADEVPVEKPKRKYNRKPKNDSAVASVASVDNMIDMLSTSLDKLSIQLHDVSNDIDSAGGGAGGAAAAAAVEKPKRKYNRKPKDAMKTDVVVDMEVVPTESISSGLVSTAASVAEVVDVTEKPKRKNTKKTKTVDSVEVAADADAAAVEKPKRKNNKKTKTTEGVVEVVAEVSAEVSASEGDEGVSEKPKRKYTKKTAVQYIDETVPEITAKIVSAAIQGAQAVVSAASAVVADADAVDGYSTETEEEPIQIVRSGTPILMNSCEEEPYYDDTATVCDDEDDDDYEDIVTKKVNIRGHDYLIGTNNKVYDCVSQKTVGKYRSDDVVLF